MLPIRCISHGSYTQPIVNAIDLVRRVHMEIASRNKEGLSQIVLPEELTADDLISWRGMLKRPPWDSPFLTPEYFQLLAKVRQDIGVLRIETESGLVFFPFQRQAKLGLPVGFPLNDIQGVLHEETSEVDDKTLLIAAGLDRFQFNHWISPQRSFSNHAWRIDSSPMADLSGGFAAYEATMYDSGSRWLKETRRKERRLAREVGPLRFDYHSTHDQVLTALIKWKREQYDRTGRVDVFDFDWVHNLCDRLRFLEDRPFRGILSALYAGDHLVAAHLGLASRDVVHFWFPAYNPEFAKYSAGMILLMQIMETAADLGYQRIDFGKGDERFKESCKTGDLHVAVGTVDRNPLRAGAYRLAFRAKHWLRRQPALATVADWPTRFLSTRYRRSIMR